MSLISQRRGGLFYLVVVEKNVRAILALWRGNLSVPFIYLFIYRGSSTYVEREKTLLVRVGSFERYKNESVSRSRRRKSGSVGELGGFVVGDSTEGQNLRPSHPFRAHALATPSTSRAPLLSPRAGGISPPLRGLTPDMRPARRATSIAATLLHDSAYPDRTPQ